MYLNAEPPLLLRHPPQNPGRLLLVPPEQTQPDSVVEDDDGVLVFFLPSNAVGIIIRGTFLRYHVSPSNGSCRSARTSFANGNR